MNALFGIFHLDGAPAEQDDLARMQASLAFWGKDGAAIWQNGPIGMGCLFQNHTPEGVGEEMLLHDTERGLTLMASARLINRRELAERLNLPAASADEADAVFILAAYQRWGEACVDYLEGDWHFAVWHAQERRLFLARDHHGTSSLYYYHDARFFAFASTQKPLLALPQIPQQPNLLHIAKILTFWRDGEKTAYTHITRLPSAHHMIVDEDNVQVRRYWFPELLPEQRLANDDAYVEGLLDVFGRAVQGRMRNYGTLGIQLSGGLDSSAVATLAAEYLRNSGEYLPAFTSVPAGWTSATQGRPADEGPAASAVADFAGNMVLSQIAAAEISPLEGIERMLYVHDEPSYPPSNSYWLHAIYMAAQHQGVTVLLSGTAGNGTVSWSSPLPNLFHDFVSGGPAEVWRNLDRICTRTGLTRRRTLLNFLVKPMLRPLRNRLQSLQTLSSTPWDEYAAIKQAFAHQIDLANAMAMAGHSPTFQSGGDAKKLRWHSVALGGYIAGGSQYEDGGIYGLDVLDPTADRRVIEFCASVPLDQYNNGVEDRWLIRRALRGYLPDSVRLKRRRGRQSADLVFRVQAHHAEFAEALARLRCHPLAAEVLDLDRMDAVLLQIEQRPSEVPLRMCSLILLKALMTGLFLLRF